MRMPLSPRLSLSLSHTHTHTLTHAHAHTSTNSNKLGLQAIKSHTHRTASRIPHTTSCVLILHVSSYYMCPHTAYTHTHTAHTHTHTCSQSSHIPTCVLTLHPDTHYVHTHIPAVSQVTYTQKSFRIPHTTSTTCVLILRTHTHTHTYLQAAESTVTDPTAAEHDYKYGLMHDFQDRNVDVQV